MAAPLSSTNVLIICWISPAFRVSSKSVLVGTSQRRNFVIRGSSILEATAVRNSVSGANGEHWLRLKGCYLMGPNEVVTSRPAAFIDASNASGDEKSAEKLCVRSTRSKFSILKTLKSRDVRFVNFRLFESL